MNPRAKWYHVLFTRQDGSFGAEWVVATSFANCERYVIEVLKATYWEIGV